MTKIKIIAAILLISYTLQADDIKSDEKQTINQQIIELQQDYDSISKYTSYVDSLTNSNKQIIESLSEKLNSYEKQYNELNKSHIDLKKNFEAVNTNLNITNKLAWYGALLLMFGLFLEVIGAVLLSGSDLSREIKPIVDIQLPLNFRDFGRADKMKDNVMRFYASIGTLLLVLGFIFQFTGTGLVIKLNFWIFICFVLFTGLIAIVLMSYLTKKGGEQKLRHKLKILFHNLFIIVSRPIRMKFCPKTHVVCDLCSKYVSVENTIVGFIQDEDPKNKDNFQPPYDFAIGHEQCIETGIPTVHRTETIGFERFRRTYSMEEFYENVYPDFKNKNDKKLNYNTEIVDETRYSLERIYKLIDKRKQ